jgi:hypothetical protein
MPFVKYTQSIPQAIASSERAAAVVRDIRTNTGDLDFTQLFNLWTAIANMRQRWKVAQADALAGNMPDVNAFLASIGGSTAAALSSDLNDIDTTSNALSAAMKTFFDNNPFIMVDVYDAVTGDGMPYKEMYYSKSISDPMAQTMRNSTQLADLDAALTALGV